MAFATTPSAAATKAVLLDYLFVQALLCDRIAQAYPELEGKAVDALATIVEAQTTKPTAYVLFTGEAVEATRSDGSGTTVRQQWAVVLVLRHAQQTDRASRNSLAGPILAKLHSLVAGWRPDPSQRPFRRASGARPTYTGQTAVYSLTFELQLEL